MYPPAHRTSPALLGLAALLLLAAPAPAAAQGGSTVDLADGWNRLVASDTTDRSGVAVEDGTWAYTSLSASWSTQELVGAPGTIWYRRTVSLPSALREGDARPALLIGAFTYGAYRVWADGILVGASGSESDAVPYPRGRVFGLPPHVTADGEVVLVLHVRPAPWAAEAVGPGSPVFRQVLLGPSDRLTLFLTAQERAEERAALAVLVFAAMALGAGLFHLVLFGTRTSQREYLWFGAACIAFAVNAFAPSPWAAPAFEGFGSPFRLTDASGHFAAAFLLLFAWRVFARPSGRVVNAYILSHGVLGALVLVAPLGWVAASASPRFLWLVPGVAMALALLVGALRQGDPDAKSLLVAVTAIATAEGAEFLRLSGAPLPAFVPYAGFTVAIFSVAAMLAGRFARHLEDLDALRRTLEQQVAERTDALRDTLRRAQMASEAKSRFLTNMSHEVRTPLNAVIGFSTVLIKRLRVTDGQLSTKELGFLERIRSNGVHLLALMDRVLDLSAIEAGAVRLETRSVDLAPLLQGIFEDMSPRAEVKGVKLETVVPGQALPIATDPVRLRQILVNLVDNAIRFTERGSVTVTVVTAGARPTRIEVRDTGAGIPADRLAVVFDAFSQADDTAGRTHYGMGLGLAITRALCDLLRFRLSLESEPGVGTVVSVDLDRAARPAPGGGASRSWPRRRPSPGRMARPRWIRPFHADIVRSPNPARSRRPWPPTPPSTFPPAWTSRRSTTPSTWQRRRSPTGTTSRGRSAPWSSTGRWAPSSWTPTTSTT